MCIVVNMQSDPVIPHKWIRVCCACFGFLLSCHVVPDDNDPTVGIPLIGSCLLSLAFLANLMWFERANTQSRDVWRAIVTIMISTVAFTAAIHTNAYLVGTIALEAVGIAGLLQSP